MIHPNPFSSWQQTTTRNKLILHAHLYCWNQLMRKMCNKFGVTQRSCGVSILRDTQILTGHGPELPAVVELALNKEVGLGNFFGYFLTSAILWFTDSVYWSLKTHLSSVTGIFQVRNQKKIIANTIVVKWDRPQLLRKLNFSGNERKNTTMFTGGRIFTFEVEKTLWYIRPLKKPCCYVTGVFL